MLTQAESRGPGATAAPPMTETRQTPATTPGVPSTDHTGGHSCQARGARASTVTAARHPRPARPTNGETQHGVSHRPSRHGNHWPGGEARAQRQQWFESRHRNTSGPRAGPATQPPGPHARHWEAVGTGGSESRSVECCPARASPSHTLPGPRADRESGADPSHFSPPRAPSRTATRSTARQTPRPPQGDRDRAAAASPARRQSAPGDKQIPGTGFRVISVSSGPRAAETSRHLDALRGSDSLNGQSTSLTRKFKFRPTRGRIRDHRLGPQRGKLYTVGVTHRFLW